MPKQAKNKNQLSRQLNVDIQREEGKDSVVRATYSTETPILEEAYYKGSWQMAWRILDHSPSSVDLSRVKDGIIVRDAHYGGEQVALGTAEIVDRKLQGNLTFCAGERAQNFKSDAENLLRRNMSIYASIDPESYVAEGEKDGSPILRVMRWKPYASDFVGFQADENAGVGREEKEQKPKIERAVKMPSTAEVKAPEINRAQIEKEAMDRGSNNAVSIYAMARQMNLKPEFADEAIQRNEDPTVFWGRAAAESEKNAGAENEVGRNAKTIGMDPKDVKAWSLHKAIRALSKGHEVDGLEREVSDEVARQSGKEAQGIYMPMDVMMRDFSTDGASGGNLVGTQHLAGSFIQILRSKMILDALGVNMAGGFVGDIEIPKQTSDTTAYHLSEGTAPTESQPVIGQVKGRPHTIGAYTDITRRLLNQSTPNAEMITMESLGAVLARGMQSALFNGSGAAGQPSGILNTAGINNPTVTAGAPTIAQINAFWGACENDNVNTETAKWAMPPLVAALLASTAMESGATERLLNMSTKMLQGFGVNMSTGVPAKTGIFGDWSNVIMALWGGLDINIDRSALSTSGGLRIVALQDYDVIVRHPEAFAYSSTFLS